MEPKQKLEEFAEQQPDRYRYYITNEALLKGTCPQMENMKLVEVGEIAPILVENGSVSAFGYVENANSEDEKVAKIRCFIGKSKSITGRLTQD